MSGNGWDAAMEALEVNKARARQGLEKGRTPSLSVSRDYYEKKAADETLPLAERTMWQRLADEITQRLNDRDDPHQDQSRLF